MTVRPILSVARAPRAPRKPSFSLLKKALRLFKAPGIPREVYRKNAAKWLASMRALGDRHILKGGDVKWGHPGDPGVRQVFAPRRLGGS